jgi:hypothetical protein
MFARRAAFSFQLKFVFQHATLEFCFALPSLTSSVCFILASQVSTVEKSARFSFFQHCFFLVVYPLISIFMLVWMTRFCDLVVRGPGYRSRGPGSIPAATRFFWEVVGLERGPLSLLSTIEELLERKSNGFELERQITAVGIHPTDSATPLYPRELALTSPTNGGRSVGTVRWRTKTKDLSLVLIIIIIIRLCSLELHYVYWFQKTWAHLAEVCICLLLSLLPQSIL